MMLLTPLNIATYLIYTKNEVGRFLLDPKLVAEGNLEILVENSTSKNYNFIINTFQTGKNYFVKQPVKFDDFDIEFLANEASYMRFFAENASCFNVLKDNVTELLHYDAINNVLIQKYIENKQQLSDFIKYPNICLPIFASLAVCMANFHSKITLAIVNKEDKSSFFKFRKPVLLDLNKNKIAYKLKQIENETNKSFFIRIIRNPDLTKKLFEISEKWKDECFIHGDMKFDNILTDNSSNPPLYIIDWELADIGDPAWDCACIIYNRVSNILKNTSTQSGLIDITFKTKKTKNDSILSVFLNKYIETKEPIISDNEKYNYLIKIIEFTGIKMLEVLYHFENQKNTKTDALYYEKLFLTGIEYISDPQKVIAKIYGSSK